MKIKLSDQVGFTLLEVLVAIFILSIGLLGMAKTQIATMRTNTLSNTHLAASSLAQAAMEDILAADGDDPRFQDEHDYAVWDGVQTLPGSGSYQVYYKTTVDYVPNVTKIDIRVDSITDVKSAMGLEDKPIQMVTFKRYY